MAPDSLKHSVAQDLEIINLLQSIYEKYGFDFRDYSPMHIKRRVANRLILSKIPDVKALEMLILSSKSFFELFIRDLSISVTAMFRDPEIYKTIREEVIPRLKTYSFVKIWHAGCATGQEVYSMAITLQEEGLYHKCLIYATDFNQNALNQAKEGIYTDEMLPEYTQNYKLSGGKHVLSDYYTSSYSRIILNKSLKKNIIWANHNLATDHVFAEVNMVMCRNVLIYFNRNLQDKAHSLFYESLVHGGFLCLGNKESLKYITHTLKYQEISKKNKIYIKKYA